MLELVDGWRPDLIVRESYEFVGAVAGPRFTHAASRIAREMRALPPFDAAPYLLGALRPLAYLNRCA